jgi:anoctamin-10
LNRLLDQSHNLPLHDTGLRTSPATRLRLLYNLLTAPGLQHGLGITVKSGRWKRVKSIVPLHDEEADKAWVERWTVGGDWQVGFFKGLGDKGSADLGQHVRQLPCMIDFELTGQQTPAVCLYFAFLTTYTLSLLPLSIISVLVYFFTPEDSYPPFYALILCLYSTIFVAVWRVRERKLSVQWGTHSCESVTVSRLRPEYVAKMGLENRSSSADDGGAAAVEAIDAGNDMKRDAKLALSVPVIMACGAGLGLVLMGLFILEAFVAQVWEGFGKEVVVSQPYLYRRLHYAETQATYSNGAVRGYRASDSRRVRCAVQGSGEMGRPSDARWGRKELDGQDLVGASTFY